MIHQGFSAALLALQFGGAGGSMAPFLLQIVAIFGIFYFLIIRPQQAQKKKHEEALRNIKRGDRIVTFGGIIGEVVHVKETVEGGAKSGMEDEVTIKSAESRLIVERGRIARIVGVSAGVPARA
ncbi:MAG TPA: preprotein translocase subunit YajC [Gemmatimonadaceae bacterium]|nr:preprotein translocase subunit YajC [Gemmatimonadaceae bacterium]